MTKNRYYMKKKKKIQSKDKKKETKTLWEEHLEYINGYPSLNPLANLKPSRKFKRKIK